MNYHKRIALTFLALAACTHNLYALELEKGITRGDPQWDSLTSADREAGYFPQAAVTSDEEGVVYVFDGGVGKTNYVEGKLLGGWPLTTYPVTLLHSEHQQVVLSRGGTEEFEDRSPSTPFTTEEASLYETDSLGCLAQTPLRYGDLNGDEQPELVVIQKDRLSISSPALKKEIFAAVWNHKDEAETRLQEEINQEGGYLNPLYENKGAQAPKYVAGSGMEYKVQRIFPAVRAYAKLYFGDFDENGTSDIIMWRKVYESNTLADEAEGFHLKAENWFHYEHAEGVYELKQTEASAVQSWLADNELTWQKGYPSESECEGEEGELIPEMHDPLLNDPDVLQ